MVDTTFSTLEVPGLGEPCVNLCSPTAPAWCLDRQEHAAAADAHGGRGRGRRVEDGKGANARLRGPAGMTLGAAGHIVVADSDNHALRRVSKAGEASTLVGNGEECFEDGQVDAARFNGPKGVALETNDEIAVADTANYAIRVVTWRRRAHAGRQRGGGLRRRAGRGRALQLLSWPGAGQ